MKRLKFAVDGRKGSDMQSGPDPDDPVEPGGPATGTEYVEPEPDPVALAYLAYAAELTEQEMAENLFLARRSRRILLAQDELLPHTMRGTHRRIPLEAVQNYREMMRARTKQALDELTRITKEVGGYDDDF